MKKSNLENWWRRGKKMHIYSGNRASARFLKKKRRRMLMGHYFILPRSDFFPLSRWVGWVGTCRRNSPKKKRRRRRKAPLEFRGDPQIDRKIPSLSLLPPLPLLQSSSCFPLNKKDAPEPRNQEISFQIPPKSPRIFFYFE